MTPTFAQLGGMFTAPALAGAGLAAVSVPIVIHILWRLRRRPRAWGAMRFLQQAYRRHKQRLRFEQLILLMVRCLILAVLGFALAGPLLGGAAARWVAGVDAGGRTVHIVIDDALPSHARDAAGTPRFDRLKHQAHAVIDAMGAGDRAAIWRAGRPARPVLAEPTSDRSVLRDAVDALEPRYGRPDVPAALRQVDAVIDEQGPAGGRAHVIVLESFSEASRYLDEPVPGALSDLGERADLWASAPVPDASNVQVERVSPHRPMVLVPGDRAEVGVRMTLRRFDRDLAAASVPVTVVLRRADGSVLASVQRDHRFAAGERSSTLNVSLAAAALDLELDDGPATAIVEARIESEGPENRIAADNRRLAVVELRRELDVALVDEPGEVAPDDAGLRPDQWLTLALDPDEDGSGGVAVRHVSPADLGADVLRGLDAAAILRPDLLSSGAWARLAEFADDGGLVWVFTPPLDMPAAWARPMSEAFGLDAWTLGLDAVEAQSDRGAALDAEAAAPDRLVLLAADWSALVRPVRVMRRLPLDVAAESVWLRVGEAAAEGDAAPGAPGAAVLAATERGAGMLLFLATALDDQWTTLVTQPLFVPLMHESLRGVLGAARDRIEPDVVAGDEPTLGPAWRNVSRLLPVTGDTGDTDEEPDHGAGEPVPLARGERGAQAGRAIERPGVYAADVDAALGSLLLAVNVDADAGDTRAVTEQRVLTWLDALGGGELMDAGDLAAMFDRDAATVNIGWPLLWLVAALILLETLLARWFSHAHQPGQRTIAGRALETLGLRFSPRATSRHETRERERAA